MYNMKIDDTFYKHEIFRLSFSNNRKYNRKHGKKMKLKRILMTHFANMKDSD